MLRLSRLVSPLLQLLVFAITAKAATIVLTPGPEGQDTQIADGNRSSVSFGNSTDLVSNFLLNNRAVGLLKFDLTALGTGASVSAASLSLFHWANDNEGAQYDIFRVTSDWSESTTWDTRPSIDGTAVSSLVFGDSGFNVYRNWDVTNLVQGWASGAYQNFGLWVEEIPVAGEATAFLSSGDDVASQRPSLSITYTSPTNRVPDVSGSSAALLLLGLSALTVIRRRFVVP